MFNLKRKNLPQEDTTSQVVFPTAKEMKNISLEHHKTLTGEEVLQEITKAAEKGKRDVYLFRSHIMGQTCSDLKEKGYKVEFSFLDKDPVIKITW